MAIISTTRFNTIANEIYQCDAAHIAFARTIIDIAIIKTWKTAAAIITGMHTYRILSLSNPNHKNMPVGRVTVHKSIVVTC